MKMANNSIARAAMLGRIYAALCPGGLLLFDMAGPSRAPSRNPQRTYAEGSDWAVLIQTETDDAKRILTRRITTFREKGELYRRDCETHQLQLVDPFEIVRSLQSIGFSVQILDCYGAQSLPQGLYGFLARKPGDIDSR